MKIVDFFYIENNLARYNYVLVEDNEENVAELKAFGCTDEEIAAMRKDDDGRLDVLHAMLSMGFRFSYKNGFYRPE